MHTLIIYDSLYGNTAQAAVFLGRQIAGAVVKSIKETQLEDVAAARLVIIGTPTHGGRASQPLQAFLATLPVSIWQERRVAVFSTGMPATNKNIFLRLIIRLIGYAATPTLSALVKKGAVPAAAPINLLVQGKEGPLLTGELERFNVWSASLK